MARPGPGRPPPQTRAPTAPPENREGRAGAHGVPGAPGRRPLGAAPARTRLREGRRTGKAPARGPGRAESGQEGPLPPTPGPGWGCGNRHRQPEKMEAASGSGPGRGRREAEARLGVRAASGVGPAGHSRGWAGRLPLRLRVVAVPVFGGRRRLGLLARSPRRGLGARPLRCLPPAPAPGDRILRRRRRLRGRTAAQRLPRRPPHCCCSRSLVRAAALRRGRLLPSRSPGSRTFRRSPGRAAPRNPRSRPEPGFDVRIAQPRRARRRAAPQHPAPRPTPLALGAPRRTGGLRAGARRNPRRAEAGRGADKSGSRGPGFLPFHLPLKRWRSAPSLLCNHFFLQEFYVHFLRPLPELLTELYFC